MRERSEGPIREYPAGLASAALGRRTSRPAWLAVLGLSFVALPLSAAKRPEPEQKKIDALLEAVRQSKAVFIRNGVEYDSAKAVSHLKFKLFMAGSRVQTARDFILGVASHSEETGKPYLIRLPGAPGAVALKDWLLARLAETEKARAPG